MDQSKIGRIGPPQMEIVIVSYKESFKDYKKMGRTS